MQVTKANPSHYTSNCILLREKLLLHQSVQRPHFDHQALQLQLAPLENNTLCGGQLEALVLTDVKTGDIPLKNSCRLKWFLIKLSKHYDHWPGQSNKLSVR